MPADILSGAPFYIWLRQFTQNSTPAKMRLHFALCVKVSYVPYKMNEKQYASVLALDSFDRYVHFVGKVADWEQLWGVKSEEGWLVPVAPEGFEYFPLWPHPEYAQKIVDENFPGHTATEISLEDLLEHWLPLFGQDKVKVAVFPNNEWTFWCIDPIDLQSAITDELAKYE